MPFGVSLRALLGSASVVVVEPDYITDSNNDRLLDANSDYIIEGGASFAVTPVGVSETDLVSGTIDGRDWHGRASMLELSNGNWVLVYRSAPAHADNGDEVLRIRFSNDKGATWTAEDTKLGGGAVSGFPMTPPGGSTTDSSGPGEPWLYLAPNGNLILHMWLIDYGVSAGGTWQSTSSDNGETWSTPAQVAFGISGTSDDLIFATDDYFVYDDTIYAGARIYQDADWSPSEMILIQSGDNGATWSKVSTIMSFTEGNSSTGGQEVGLEYLGSDTIIAMLRDNAHQASYKRVSTNMGSTWGVLTDVTSEVGIAARQRVFTVDHLKGESSWWDDDVLLMVGFEHKESGSSMPRQNCVWISEDGGATWDQFYMGSQTEDAGYGDILYDSGNDEFVFVTYHGTQAEAMVKAYRFKLYGED